MLSSVSFDSVLATTVPSGASTLLRRTSSRFAGLRVPAVLEPGLPLLLGEEMCVDDVVGLDHGLLGRDLGRGDADAAVQPEVGIARGDQPHMPVDPRAGIPAQRRFKRIVDPDGEDVGRAVGLQKLREVVAETDEAVRPAAEKLAVDPDLAVHVHAVELDDDLLAGRRAKREVSSDTSRCRGGRNRRSFAGRGRVSGPRCSSRAARRACASSCRRSRAAAAGLVAEVETPARIEGDDFPRAGRWFGGRQGGRSEAEQGTKIKSAPEQCEQRAAEHGEVGYWG